MIRLAETIKFTDEILAVAKQKAGQITSQAESEKQRLLDEAKANLSKEANDVIRNANSEAEGIKRREISEVRHRVKLREESEKDKILSEVLEQTKKKVLEITKDENRYLTYLARLTADAIRQLDFATVTMHMNSTDLKNVDGAKLVSEVKKLVHTNASIEISKEPITSSGGVIVSNQDGKIKIVNTFEQRFEALEPKLLIESGRLLFRDPK